MSIFYDFLVSWFFDKSGNQNLVFEVLALIEEIQKTPFTGKDKPEASKLDLSGYWSGRINDEHRLIYKISGNKLRFIHAQDTVKWALLVLPAYTDGSESSKAERAYKFAG